MKIDMTAPVLTLTDGRYERQWFYLPEIHHQDPPKPTGSNVENVRWDYFDVYTLYFNSTDRSERMDKPMQAKLVAALEQAGHTLKPDHVTVMAGYSGPWAPTIEREVWITA